MKILIERWRTIAPVRRGIMLMALSTVFIGLMHVLIRYVSAELHPFQIAFFRNLFGLVLFLPFFVKYGLGPLRTKRLPMHALRGALNIGAMLMYFMALAIAPIAEVTALGFTAPIFAALLGILILGEKVRFRRWAAIVLGFAGTLIILRPGFQEIGLGQLLVCCSTFLWGITLIVIKQLGRTESSITITIYMNLLLSVFSIVPAILVWRMPTLEAWGLLFLLGILGTLGQVAIAQSLKEAEAGIVMPLDFLKLVWVSIFGWFLFGEGLDVFVWVGAGIVLGSASYIAYRESRLGKPTVRPQDG